MEKIERGFPSARFHYLKSNRRREEPPTNGLQTVGKSDKSFPGKFVCPATNRAECKTFPERRLRPCMAEKNGCAGVFWKPSPIKSYPPTVACQAVAPRELDDDDESIKKTA
ncbi:MAG: hypothetical protein IT426_07965 [Pirellulales bacterium]|nr:hypothetical protein [Pirellulales bacterium]